jgi:hypothetical protein
MFLPSSLGMVLPRALLDPIDESLWNPAESPPGSAFGEATAFEGVNLGTVLTCEVIGDIHSLCYYRASAAMAATGTLSLWKIGGGADDVLLAQVAFSGHSGTGWRVVALPASVKSSPAYVYVVSLWTPAVSGTLTYIGTANYFADRGHFSENNFLYATVSNGQFDIARRFLRRNGLYKYGPAARPTEEFGSTNYWVDLVINARPKPIPPLPPIVLKWPIPDGYPNLTNTGVDPDTTFTVEEEDIGTTVDGQVIEDLEVHGIIAVRNSNVTIQNCKFRSVGPYIIYILPGTTGTVIQDCDIDGIGRNNLNVSAIACFGDNVQLLRNNLYRIENGISMSGSNHLVKDNFLHNLRAGPGGPPHYDGLQCDGNNNSLTVEHNTIFNENGDTSTVMLDNNNGPSDTVTVKDNYLAGAGYTCYYDARFHPEQPLSNVTYLRNIMRQGGYGYFSINGGTPVRQGNQFLDHGGLYDNPPPGGFTIGQAVPECFFGLEPDLPGSVVGETVPAATGLTLGVSFTVPRNSLVTAVKFARPGASSCFTAKIGLWRWLGANKSEGVALLGTRTIENVGRTSWVAWNFEPPLAVNAHDNLLVGVFIPRGTDGKVWYIQNYNVFAANVPSQYATLTAFNGVGTALNGFVGCNGMYAYGADLTAPINSGEDATNYYVDPIVSAPWS